MVPQAPVTPEHNWVWFKSQSPPHPQNKQHRGLQYAIFKAKNIKSYFPRALSSRPGSKNDPNPDRFHYFDVIIWELKERWFIGYFPSTLKLIKWERLMIEFYNGDLSTSIDFQARMELVGYVPNRNGDQVSEIQTRYY